MQLKKNSDKGGYWGWAQAPISLPLHCRSRQWIIFCMHVHVVWSCCALFAPQLLVSKCETPFTNDCDYDEYIENTFHEKEKTVAINSPTVMFIMVQNLTVN